MAIELTLKRLEAAIHKRSEPVHVPAHILVGIAATVALVSIAGLLAGIHSSHDKEQAAQTRFMDAQALLALPPLSTTQLKSELDAAKFELAIARGLSTQSVDATSDDVMAQLVRQAQSSGLAVSGVSRLSPASTKLGDVTYDVHGVRIVTDGPPAQLLSFLSMVQNQLPALLPSLISMTISDAGVTHADIAFNAYTKPAPPTPVATAPGRSAAR